MGTRALEVGQIDQELARLLKSRADELGKSARSVGRDTEIHHNRVAQYFRGERPFLVGELISMAESLQTSATVLITEALSFIDENSAPEAPVEVVEEDVAELTQDDYDLAALTMTDRMKQQIEHYRDHYAE